MLSFKEYDGSDCMVYLDYIGSIQYCTGSEEYCGEVLNKNKTIKYQAITKIGLFNAFIKAVNEDIENNL